MANCPYCLQEVKLSEANVACPKCRSLHHADCWESNGEKCGVHLCTGGRSAANRDEQPVPIYVKDSAKVISGTALPTRSKTPTNLILIALGVIFFAVILFGPALKSLFYNPLLSTPIASIETTQPAQPGGQNSPAPLITYTYTPTARAGREPTPTFTPSYTVTQRPTPVSNVVPAGKIVFSCNDSNGFAQICSIRPDGSAERQLVTHDNAASTYPSLSKDGRTLVFTSNHSIDHTIYEMDLNSQVEVKRSKSSGDKAFPILSPDGKSITFSDVENKVTNIYVMNRDGSNVHKIFDKGSRATWSPDGQKFAFICVVDNTAQICTMDINGNNVRQVTTNLQDLNAWVSWSPDANRLVFSTGNKANADRKICDIGVDGNDYRVLFDKGDAIAPSYSPDGNWIVFVNYIVNNQNIKGELFIMRKDGSDVRQITHNDRSDWLPFWGND